MTLKRKKVFTSMVKKEVSKQHRDIMNKHKEMLIQCKRVALQCQKEHEAEEQRKTAKNQQRKLNFLITQTELYAHYMSKTSLTDSPEEQLRILNQIDEKKNPSLTYIDDYDCHLMKAKAMKNAEEAFQSERARTKKFDMEANSKIDMKKTKIEGEHPQPLFFRGILKGYQLKGMNWLVNLYDKGISGILTDEMGLGKFIQSIAFLCHIAEKYSVWGPFLIISPAPTLHNWQHEISQLVPEFKVVPYWGNPNERKILDQFWDQKDMHTKDASFHIVVTSYQIFITDIKYFNQVKWQYMIVDEAQAIKSTSRIRCKTLLGFSCRNRLLLSGTPIQNTMAELWAHLHFIMPTFFDSDEEFNEWFLKDIESYVENKSGIDEKQLSRLHMILKPFMLRRIKKDVENEFPDKIEVMVYCPLTTRQKLLYMALKQKIQIEDLLYAIDKNVTSNLMNLVVQFRKVCNHPELFIKRDAKSPMSPLFYEIPYSIDDFNVRRNKTKSHIVIPDKETLVTDSGKLSVLDGLLKQLKEEGHRVLIYSQMTEMIDLLEEYMCHRHHKYMRLDGSSKISDRRDMAADFQARADIFVFLLSTRAGGLGINLTAADTVIFYDSDWNPTVDQQAMDGVYRLGQTKQVTIYRLICKDSIEERILQRAREKSKIQKLVISGGNFKPDTLTPKEVVSLLLDDEEMKRKYHQRTEERKVVEDTRKMERKRKHRMAFKIVRIEKKLEQKSSGSGPSSSHSDSSVLTGLEGVNDDSFLDVEGDTSIHSKYTVDNLSGAIMKPRIPGRGSSIRGRHRGSRQVSALGRFNSNAASTSSTTQTPAEIGADFNPNPSASALTSFALPGTSSTPPTFISQGTTSIGYVGSLTVRGSPGRQRLKPGGTPHAGSRGPYRPRKLARLLPAPLPSDGDGNSAVSNSGYSSYLFDYPQQPPDS